MLRIIHTSRLDAKRLLTSSSCRCQFVAVLDLQWFPLNPKVDSKETVGSELQRHWTLEKSEITQQLFPCPMGGIWIWLLFFYCAGSHLPMSARAKHEYVFILPVGFLFSSFILRLINVYGAEGGPPMQGRGKMLLKWLFKCRIDIEIDACQCRRCFCC